MKKPILIAALSGILFVLMLVVLNAVDVAPVGPMGTSVGLSGLNSSFHALTGTNQFLYDLTGVLGIVSLGAGCLFALLGLWQLMRRRSLWLVDGPILALGVLYAVMAGLYVLFEKVIVNYRPVIMPGSDVPEASFPSSHTMLVCVIMGSILMLLGRYIRDDAVRMGLTVVCWAIIVVMVLGRLVCGVHWLTDILSGVLLSGVLLGLYAGVLEEMEPSSPRRSKGMR